MAKQTLVDLLTKFTELEDEARKASDLKSLAFVICNRTKALLSYDQGILFSVTGSRFEVLSISGLSTVKHDAPYLQWLCDVLQVHHKQSLLKGAGELNKQCLPQGLQLSWNKWLTHSHFFMPIVDADGVLLGGLLLTRSEHSFAEHEQVILEKLMRAYSHAWNVLLQLSFTQPSQIARKNRQKKWLLYALAVIIILACLPVHQTLLAPAEIVADQPVIVSSPIAGVIDKFYVRPNQVVEEGDTLFSLDPITSNNQLAIAENALMVAKEKYRKATQHAFSEHKSQSELAILKTDIKKAELELKYARDMSKRVMIRAKQAGIAIFSNQNHWLGKPIIVGEKVLLIADPKRKVLDVKIPVNSAITLKKGAHVKFFLNVDPMNPVRARLIYASYSAFKDPLSGFSYMAKARFTESKRPVPRIGLRGTAKIYGQKVSALYYLFWRPLSFLRRVLGV